MLYVSRRYFTIISPSERLPLSRLEVLSTVDHLLGTIGRLFNLLTFPSCLSPNPNQLLKPYSQPKPSTPIPDQPLNHQIPTRFHQSLISSRVCAPPQRPGLVRRSTIHRSRPSHRRDRINGGGSVLEYALPQHAPGSARSLPRGASKGGAGKV